MNRFILFSPAALIVSTLFSGCTTPGEPQESPPMVMNETQCRTDVEKALGFKTLPGQTRNFLNGMAKHSGRKLQPFLDSYYEVLGHNLSSISLMLNDRLDRRISLDINQELDPAVKAKWIQQGLEHGNALFTRNDIASTAFDGEFLRVVLKPDLPLTGYFYIHCGVIEGREIGAKSFVDFEMPNGELRKLSFVAVGNLLEQQ